MSLITLAFRRGRLEMSSGVRTSRSRLRDVCSFSLAKGETLDQVSLVLASAACSVLTLSGIACFVSQACILLDIRAALDGRGLRHYLGGRCPALARREE